MTKILTKTEKAIKIFESGDKKSALALFKTFKMGVNKEEQKVLQIAHEMLSGKEKFYNALGYSLPDIMGKADSIINNNWCRK